MTLRELQKQAIEEIKAVAGDSANVEAGWLIEGILGIAPVEMIQKSGERLLAKQIEHVKVAIARRKSGEPLAHILGQMDFYGRTFLVTNDTLIPRPETETLVGWAIEIIKEKFWNAKSLNIADFGVGTGCVGISIVLELKKEKFKGDVQLFGIEKSEAALSIAMKNGEAHDLGEQITWILGGVEELPEDERFENLKNTFHVVVSNPPYIAEKDPDVEESVRKHEPAMALFSGEDGLDAVRSWLPIATQLLVEGGVLGFEIGHEQHEIAKQLFRDQQNLSGQYLLKDLFGKLRFICGERKS